jgi:hypothetical protein
MKEAVAAPFSRRVAALYCLLLIGVLLGPLLLRGLGRPTRREVYREMSGRGGNFAAIERELFDRSGDVEMLFVGSSVIWAGIDTPQVDTALRARHGEQGRALTLACNWRSEDMTYVLLRDFFARRRAKNVVVSMRVYEQSDDPHPYSQRFMIVGDDPVMVAGLSFAQRARLYAAAVMGSPRHILGLLRPNLIEPPDVLEEQLRGASMARLGFQGAAYQPSRPMPPVLAPDDLVYSGRTRQRFSFRKQPLGSYQLHFVRRVQALAKEHGAKLVLLHVTTWEERADTTVVERMPWPAVLGEDVPLIGVPGATLFAGMNDDEIKTLYYDSHLNANGATYFTAAIMPALLALQKEP